MRLHRHKTGLIRLIDGIYGDVKPGAVAMKGEEDPGAC